MFKLIYNTVLNISSNVADGNVMLRKISLISNYCMTLRFLKTFLNILKSNYARAHCRNTYYWRVQNRVRDV